MIYYSPNLAI